MSSSPAKQIDDAVSGHAKEPGAGLFDRADEPGGLDELGEHVLQDVFGVGHVGDAASNEAFEAARLASQQLGDAPVLLENREFGGQWALLPTLDARGAEILSGDRENPVAARPGVRQAGNGGMGRPGVANTISVMALMLRLPYRKGTMRRRGAPCRGGIGASFISQASMT